MTDLSILQDGKSYGMPCWAKALSDIGSFMDDLGAPSDSKPSVVGICLPRIDYAALFVGVGVFLGTPKASPAHSSPDLERLSKLVGSPVAYQKNERTFLGILESINTLGTLATIVERSAKVEMNGQASEPRRAVREQRFTIEVKHGDWSKIHASSTSFDLRTGATRRQAGRAASQQCLNMLTASVFSHEVADRIASLEQPLATACVEKHRFLEECSRTILATKAGQITAGEALNTEAQRAGSSIDVRSASSPVSEDTANLLIIEGGRRLGDQLAQLSKRRAVVLLGRNRASYKEASAQFCSHLSRHGEWPHAFAGINLPAYLKVISGR